jgi:DNA-binding response OmpR family regulator
MEQPNQLKPERRILVADVDPDSRVVIASVISVLGYTPCVVQSGAEALSVSQEEPLDLAILDYSMPDIDGLQVCHSIKEARAGDFVPVLMLTARDTVRDKVRAFSGGVDEYLTKPINYEELQARINALLRIRDLHHELVKANQELQRVQEKLIAQERQLAVGQLAGAAAHQLGQPLSSILLNCFLIEQLPKSDAKFVGAVGAIKNDARRMAEMIDKLRSVDAAEREAYFGSTEILRFGSSQKKDTEKL